MINDSRSFSPRSSASSSSSRVSHLAGYLHFHFPISVLNDSQESCESSVSCDVRFLPRPAPEPELRSDRSAEEQHSKGRIH